MSVIGIVNIQRVKNSVNWRLENRDDEEGIVDRRVWHEMVSVSPLSHRFVEDVNDRRASDKIDI